MSKEREYYRKVINEYYQPIVYKNLAKAVLGIFVANKMYEKVKSKIYNLDEKKRKQKKIMLMCTITTLMLL